MIRKLILSLIVAVVVTLGYVLLGTILIALDVSIASTVGAFLRAYSAALGILAGLWYFFAQRVV